MCVKLIININSLLHTPNLIVTIEISNFKSKLCLVAFIRYLVVKERIWVIFHDLILYTLLDKLSIAAGCYEENKKARVDESTGLLLWLTFAISYKHHK